MSAETRQAVPIEPASDFDSVYAEHLGLLVGVATSRFHISEQDAQTLAHDVFLSYFLKSGEIFSTRSWLVAAMFNASRHYLRRESRTVELLTEHDETPDPRSSRASEMWPDQLAAREAFACCTARCQLALRLRYLEGYAMREIAEELKTTAKYAEKLVYRCLEQAQTRYANRKGEVR